MFSPTPLSDELKSFIGECMGENPWEFKCAVKGVVETVFKKD
jgi:hypothetical protein